MTANVLRGRLRLEIEKGHVVEIEPGSPTGVSLGRAVGF
jgi:hypothetical protein